jgi:hypothetical protein
MTGISLLSHAISDDPQQFSDVVGKTEWEACHDRGVFFLDEESHMGSCSSS